MPIGRPIAHSSAYVLDAEFVPVAAGSVGELYVGGDGVARGYVNLPELTAERFLADPFGCRGRSTDVSYRRSGATASRRYARFCGRADGQVKVRGFRVELGEIEAALRTAPPSRMLQQWSRNRADTKKSWPSSSPRQARRSSERALRSHLASSVPAYMLPNRIVMRDALPRNPSGKLDRAALESIDRAPLPPKAVPRFVRGGAAAELEQTIGAIWRELLGHDGELDGISSTRVATRYASWRCTRVFVNG